MSELNRESLHKDLTFVPECEEIEHKENENICSDKENEELNDHKADVKSTVRKCCFTLFF